MTDLHVLLAKHRAVAEADGVWVHGRQVETPHPLMHPEVALALNAVAEAAKQRDALLLITHNELVAGMSFREWREASDEADLALRDALTQLKEVMQRKIGDEG